MQIRVQIAKLTKQDWPIASVTIKISAQNNLKHFITKVLEYKAGLNGRIKSVYVATFVFLSDKSLFI